MFSQLPLPKISYTYDLKEILWYNVRTPSITTQEE